MNRDRERLRTVFDEVAELYESARPGYPESLVDDLFEIAGLGAGADICEIGCGTGQATRMLARRGSRVVCVEIGPRLAEVARRSLAGFASVRIVTSPFEAWNPGPAQRFDLVVAATSWHWLDASTRYEKAAAVLRPHGALAIVTTSHVLPDGGDRFFVDVQDAYAAIGEGGSGPPAPDDVGDLRAEIESSGLFTGVVVRRYLWERAYTAEAYIAVLETYSGHRAIDRAARDELYTEIRRRIDARPDGLVRKHYLNVLNVARLTA